MQAGLNTDVEEFLEEVKKFQSIQLSNSESCEEEIHEEEDFPILESLKKDYLNFMRWAFKKELMDTTKGRAKKRWENLHPDLPIPRVLLTEKNLSRGLSTTFLFLDAFPMYLQEKNNKICGEKY